MYYETLCPDSQEFINFQLWPAFLKVPDIFNLELVPYGKATVSEVSYIVIEHLYSGTQRVLSGYFSSRQVYVKQAFVT